jgi:hypothetical protein
MIKALTLKKGASRFGPVIFSHSEIGQTPVLLAREIRFWEIAQGKLRTTPGDRAARDHGKQKSRQPLQSAAWSWAWIGGYFLIE